MPPAQRIVVGVDGSPTSKAALGWAVDECALRGRQLLIVHSVDPDDPFQTALPTAGPGLVDETGVRLLNACLAYASNRQPRVLVSSQITYERPADALVDLSSDSDLVVVGTRGHNALKASMLGSVSTTLSTHAHCPVAVISHSDEVSADAGPPRVIVGLSAGRSAAAALEFAIDEAARRAASVTVLQGKAAHAGSVSASTVVRQPVDGELSRYLEQLRAEHPEVPISARSTTLEPADALLRLSRCAQLLVIGCHHSDDQWSTRLGPVASSVLHRAPCPVVVVGSPNRPQRQHTWWPETLALNIFFL